MTRIQLQAAHLFWLLWFGKAGLGWSVWKGASQACWHGLFVKAAASLLVLLLLLLHRCDAEPALRGGVV